MTRRLITQRSDIPDTYYTKSPEYYRRWRFDNRDKVRTMAVIRERLKLGVDTTMYESMLVAQNGVCAICHRSETRISKYGGLVPLSVDHDHATEKVRGLLCATCNRAIGLMSDDPIRVRAAAEYLDRHR